MKEVEDKKLIFIKDLGMQYPTENSKHKSRFSLFMCGYCGKEFRGYAHSTNIGCGCQRGLGHKHGLESHRLYPVWNTMKQRCTNPKHKNYSNYGGRGITICEEWLDVKNFIEWSKSSGWSEGLSIDRIDNDKGYNPDNCRWADATIQACNQGFKKNNTSGFVGVYLRKGRDKYTATVGVNYKTINVGTFKTIEEAVQARDSYIIENKLPHKLSTEYKKEHQ